MCHFQTSVDVPNHEALFEDGEEVDQYASYVTFYSCETHCLTRGFTVGGWLKSWAMEKTFLGSGSSVSRLNLVSRALQSRNVFGKARPLGPIRQRQTGTSTFFFTFKPSLTHLPSLHAGEPPLPFPLPPPFVPLQVSGVDSQIGLLKGFYEDKFKALAAANPASTAPPATGVPAAPTAPIPASLVLPDEPPNPARTKLGPLGQVIPTNPATAAGKKKGRAAVPEGSDALKKKESKKKKPEQQQEGKKSPSKKTVRPLDGPPAIIASA